MAGTLSFLRPGIWEIAVILLVVVAIFGAARLPRIGRALGEAIRGFRKAAKGEGENPPC